MVILSDILQRATAAAITEQLKIGSGTLRVVRDTRSGDIHTWDAELALHEEAIRLLGLGDHAENLGQIHSVAQLKRLVSSG